MLKRQQDGLKPPIIAAKMTYAHTANFLGVSERTLRRWVKRDRIPHYKLGRRVYFDELDLLRWIETCRVEVTE